MLTEGTDYKWMPAGDNGSFANAGSYEILLFGRGQFAGAIQATYSIKAKKITPTVTLSKSSYTYNGKVRKPGVTVKYGGTVLKKKTDYTVSYADGRKNAGKYNVNVKLKGNYEGKKTVSFTINKAANPLKIKRGKTAVISGASKGEKGKLKKTRKLDVSKVITFKNKGKGPRTYLKKSGNKKISISKKTGKVTVLKGLPKGTYKVKVKVRAAGNANYKKSSWKTVTFRIKVK